MDTKITVSAHKSKQDLCLKSSRDTCNAITPYLSHEGGVGKDCDHELQCGADHAQPAPQLGQGGETVLLQESGEESLSKAGGREGEIERDPVQEEVYGHTKQNKDFWQIQEGPGPPFCQFLMLLYTFY